MRPSVKAWQPLVWLAIYAVAMGLLEAICVIYLRRLFPVETNYPIPPLNRMSIEIIREVCTLVMLVAAAWLAGSDFQMKIACFFGAFGLWDIFYYAGLYWLCGWPDGWLVWDCLFLIPTPWYGPVLAPLLISCYFVFGCVWLQAQRISGRSIRLSLFPLLCQAAAFVAWYWSFVKDAGYISKHAFKDAVYSWPLFFVGLLMALAGLWLAARPVPQTARPPVD